MKFEKKKLFFLFSEDQVPVIENSDCKQTICAICRERTANLDDICRDIKTESSTFFVMVVTHKPHQNGKVTFSGLNLKDVTLVPN